MKRRSWLRFSVTRLFIAVAIVGAGFAFHRWLFPPPKSPFLFISKFEIHPGQDTPTSDYINLQLFIFTRNGTLRETYVDHRPWGTVNLIRDPVSGVRFEYREELLGTMWEKTENPQPVPEIYQARYDQLMEIVREHVDPPPEEQPFGLYEKIPLPRGFPTFVEFRDAYVKKHGTGVLTRPAPPSQAVRKPASANDDNSPLPPD